MKKLSVFISLCIVFGLFVAKSSLAQFQGVIYFDKIKSETTKYVYYIKGKKVRIDEFSDDGEVKGVMLVDLGQGTVTALHPERKLYMDASNKTSPSPSNIKVTKTTNKQTIHGVECVEWIARSEDEGTEISYWVILESKYDFFQPLLKTLNRKDRISKYFLECDGIDKKFTMKGIEKSLDGSVRTSLEVTKIEEKNVDNSLFQIPSDYVKFEK